MTKKREVQQAFKVLRGAYVDPVSEQKATDKDLLTLERRMLRALERDESATAELDGYPTGAGLGVAVGGVSVPTENAALADRYADVVHNIAEAARGYINQAANSLAAARMKLDELDVVSGITADHLLPEESCESCARVKLSGDKVHSPMYLFSDVGKRLSRKWRLCGWCYDLVRRCDPEAIARKSKGRAEKDADWLPDEERIIQHVEGRLERQKAS